MMLLEVFSKSFKRNLFVSKTDPYPVVLVVVFMGIFLKNITLGVVRFTKLFMNKLLLGKVLTVLSIKIV